MPDCDTAVFPLLAELAADELVAAFEAVLLLSFSSVDCWVALLSTAELAVDEELVASCELTTALSALLLLSVLSFFTLSGLPSPGALLLTCETVELTCEVERAAPLLVPVETFTIALAALSAKINDTKATGVISGGVRYAMLDASFL